MGVASERMHQDLDDGDAPVTQRECYLYRQLIEQHVGSLEIDITDMRSDIKNMRAENAEYHNILLSQFNDLKNSFIERDKKIYVILAIILTLVAMSGIINIEGIFPVVI